MLELSFVDKYTYKSRTAFTCVTYHLGRALEFKIYLGNIFLLKSYEIK